MRPWLLLVIPVWLFVFTWLIQSMFQWTTERKKWNWWTLPLYLAVVFPLVIIGIAGMLVIGATAFGAFE